MEILVKGKIILVDDEDCNKVNQYKWYITKKGYLANNQYLGGGRKNPKYKRLFLHHLIIGREKDKTVDHINGNQLDNRKENLRFATQQQQAFNRKLTIVNKSGYKGVDAYCGKWRARIELNNKKIKLGVFDSKLDAAKAYNEAAKKYHGEFARLNIL